MRRIMLVLTCAVAFAAVLAGCAKGTAPNARRTPLVAPGVAMAAEAPAKGDPNAHPSTALADATDAFGFNLFREMRSGRKGNLLVSPFSVSSALAMTANGAAGGTRSAMERTLGIDALGRDASNRAFADTVASLMRPPGAGTASTLTVANALWIDTSLPVKPDFLARDRDFFGAQVTYADFSDEAAAVRSVNDWASANTHGKIPKAIDQLPDGAIMELVNTVYFKDDWAEPFKHELTQQRDFTAGSGATSKVPMMARTGQMDHVQTPKYQAVRLPYVSGRDMVVVLPEKGVGIAELEKSLNGGMWKPLVASFTLESGDLELPRFTAREKASLVEPLTRMGMALAFNANAADFTGISTNTPTGQPIYIGSVDHNVYVAVDEKGTEAAASTAIGMAGAGMTSSAAPPFQMIVDRPFFFAITDEATGQILFMGTIDDPTKSD